MRSHSTLRAAHDSLVRSGNVSEQDHEIISYRKYGAQTFIPEWYVAGYCDA